MCIKWLAACIKPGVHNGLKAYIESNFNVQDGGLSQGPRGGGPEDWGGGAGRGSIGYTSGCLRAGPPRPLEKTGRVGLGYKETETETFKSNFFIFMKRIIDKYLALYVLQQEELSHFCLQVLLESVHAQCSMFLFNAY